MIELILIIVFSIVTILSYINNKRNELNEKEKIIFDLKRKLSGINILSRTLLYSDYGMGFLLNGLTLTKDLRNKRPLQIKKELLKINEPRLELLQFKEQKEKLIKVIKFLEWDDLISLTFVLYSYGIKVETDWELIIDDNFDPTFSYLPGFEFEMNADMEIENIESFGKGLGKSAFKIDMGTLIPEGYYGNFNWEGLCAFNRAQYLIFQYIYKKEKILFDAISTTDDSDELFNLLKREPSKQRFELTIDIKKILNEIPAEFKEKGGIYISGISENIFDAIVEQKNIEQKLPDFLKMDDQYLISLYILQFLGKEAEYIAYVHNESLLALKELLKKKRGKIEYEKEFISTTGEKIIFFISHDLRYINGAWKDLNQFLKK